MAASDGSPGRILVLRPGAIGDTILTLPALLAMRSSFPGCTIEVAGNASALPLAAAAGVADSWLSFDDPRVTRLFLDSELAATEPFVGLTLAVAWCSDPDGTLARGLMRRGARRPVIAPSRPPSASPVSVARYLLQTLAPLGVSVGEDVEDGVDAERGSLPLPHIEPPGQAIEQATAALTGVGLGTEPFLIVQPGSGSPSKNWPADRFAAVIAQLRQRSSVPALVLGGPADDDALQSVSAALPEGIPILTGLPLVVVAALMLRSVAFLGNDSGLSHLAGMLGIPTLVLFGPSDPTLWRPLGPQVKIMRSHPLSDLSPEAVLAALIPMMTRGLASQG